MAALTANRLLNTFQFLASPDGQTIHYPVAASTVIYKGGFVGLNTAGNLVMYAPATVGTTIVGNFRLVGVALEACASQTSAGKMVEVMTCGRIQATVGSTTIADIGKPVFATTSNPADMSLACPGNAFAGYILDFITVDECIIAFNPWQHGGGMPMTLWSTPIISSLAANLVTIVPKSANPGGLVIYDAYAIVTTTFTGAGIYTLQDTAATTLLTTFTMGAGSVAGDIVQAATNSADITATDAALTLVPAGLGIDILVTDLDVGAAKFFVHVHPST